MTVTLIKISSKNISGSSNEFSIGEIKNLPFYLILICHVGFSYF